MKGTGLGEHMKNLLLITLFLFGPVAFAVGESGTKEYQKEKEVLQENVRKIASLEMKNDGLKKENETLRKRLDQHQKELRMIKDSLGLLGLNP